MDTWDDDDSSKKPSNSFGKNQWEGEDEEDDVQDSWDQEPEEESHEESEKPATIKPIAKDKKRKKDPDASSDIENHEKEMTLEEIIAEKLLRQKLQEESDLDLAKEIFGVCSLETKEDFDKFREEITRKISDCSKNAEFVGFAEQIIQVLCLHLTSFDLKRVHNLVGNLHIEKLKMEKGDKKKHKHKIKAKLKMDDETDYNEYSAYTEDFGDFM